MSGIVLSASVRQNLLSLQSTASLLATTQNNLATGNKVNSALDNPTNFFTAQGLNNRASDIGNLLDSIGNGVQVLQAANTGITSLQKLVDSAKSIANQVLQSPVGYSAKSSFTVALGAGATAANLFAGSSFTAATLTGVTATNNLTTPADITAATSLTKASNTDSITAAISNGDTLTVDGHTITFKTGATPTASALAAAPHQPTLRRLWQRRYRRLRQFHGIHWIRQRRRLAERHRPGHRCQDRNGFHLRSHCRTGHLHDRCRRHRRLGQWLRAARRLDRYHIRSEHQLEQSGQ